MHSVVGDYLEAIYSLQAEGHEAHAITLAGLFAVSRAAASATVSRLERDGLIECDHRNVTLTVAGHLRAEEGLRRHCLTEKFLTDVLGIDWTIAHDQARAFERGLSPVVEERIDDRLARPEFCPHGNPIPRPGLNVATYYADTGAFVLASAPTGAALRVLAVSELAEREAVWMRTFGALGLRPATAVTLRARGARYIDLLIGPKREPARVDTGLAARLWVLRAEGEISQAP